MILCSQQETIILSKIFWNLGVVNIDNPKVSGRLMYTSLYMKLITFISPFFEDIL